MPKGYTILKGVDDYIKWESTPKERESGAPNILSQKEVVLHSEQGWKLYGNPFLDKEGNICQAMTKNVES